MHIAGNLNHLGLFAMAQSPVRITLFFTDTDKLLNLIDPSRLSVKFRPTYSNFLRAYASLKSSPPNADSWAETAFTWGQILTHRAQLA